MFSSDELKILKAAYEKHGFSDPYADVGIVPGKPDPVYHAACGLVFDGLISMDRRGCVAIEAAGIRALHAAEEAAKKEAQERADQDAEKREAKRLIVKDARRSWLQFFLGLFIGWILGCFTPLDLIGFVSSLFK